MTILHAIALTIIALAFAFGIGAITATVWPNRRKIWSALRGQGRV